MGDPRKDASVHFALEGGMMGIEYRVLGRLEVFRHGERVERGSHKQRSVLALMLTRPNSVVATDTLLDEIWGDDGGIDKQNTLWVYISGLRTALDPERAKRTDGSVLLTRSPGYVLTLEEGMRSGSGRRPTVTPPTS